MMAEHRSDRADDPEEQTGRTHGGFHLGVIDRADGRPEVVPLDWFAGTCLGHGLAAYRWITSFRR